jgi:hypothetical protein
MAFSEGVLTAFERPRVSARFCLFTAATDGLSSNA